jgi:hypothetical protein
MARFGERATPWVMRRERRLTAMRSSPLKETDSALLRGSDPMPMGRRCNTLRV